VLLVDDDRATRDGYAEYLASAGYDIRTAATGGELLELATVWNPHVIVLDLGLPDIDGWEVARRLKADPRMVNVPIIAVTGANLAHERVSAMRAGCDRHLTKPCSPADVIDAIRRCVDDVPL
jgi:CheY-like chemotaxis protein